MKFPPAQFVITVLLATLISAQFDGFSVFGQQGQASAARAGFANVTRLERSRKSVNLSRSFLTGVLPAPARAPSGTIDEQAAALASNLAAGNENSTAALYASVLAAGFAVRNVDKTITQPAKSGQGLVFDAGQLAAIAKMYGEDRSAPLGEIGALIAGMSPRLNKDQIADLVLGSIKRHAQDGGNPSLRFWARFIVELGRQKGIDLLALKSAAGVRIDPVQHSLIMQRLIGDFVAHAERNKKNGQGAQGAIFTSAKYISPTTAGAHLYLDVLFLKPAFMTLAPVAVRPPQQSPPCKLDGDAGTIMDAGALIASTGFGELLGYLEDNLGKQIGGNLGKYGNFVSAANALLAYLKFIQSYAAIETTIEMEGTGPLIRTRNAVPGARRRFVAATRMNIGNWQAFNCVRMAMVATTGIDFNTMNDGPLAGVIMTWHLDKGGAGDRYSNSTGLSDDEQIVGIVNEGPRIQDKGAYAGIPGKDGGQVSNGTRTTTDDQGKANITVEGSPQKNHKMGKVTPVIKRARLRTNIQLKGGDIKGDAVDALSQAAGGAAGVITMPAELLYRTDWASTAHHEFDVQDWEDSDEVLIKYVYTGYKRLDAEFDECPKMRKTGQEIFTARVRRVGSRDGRVRYEGSGQFSADIDGCGLTPNRKDPGQHNNGSGFGGYTGDSFLGCTVTTVAPEHNVQVALDVKPDEDDSSSGSIGVTWRPAGSPPVVQVKSGCERPWHEQYIKNLTDEYARERGIEISDPDDFRRMAPGGILRGGSYSDPDASPDGKWTITITKVDTLGSK